MKIPPGKRCNKRRHEKQRVWISPGEKKADRQAVYTFVRVTSIISVRFEILKAVPTKIAILWDVTLSTVIGTFQYFGKTNCFNDQVAK